MIKVKPIYDLASDEVVWSPKQKQMAVNKLVVRGPKEAGDFFDDDGELVETWCPDLVETLLGVSEHRYVSDVRVLADGRVMIELTDTSKDGFDGPDTIELELDYDSCPKITVFALNRNGEFATKYAITYGRFDTHIKEFTQPVNGTIQKDIALKVCDPSNMYITTYKVS